MQSEAFMSRTFNRALAGAFALLAAVAVVDVATAHAQSSLQPGIVPTPCQSGAINECGEKEIQTCSWKIEFNLSSLPWGGGFTVFVQECHVSGRYKLYKDLKEGSFKPCPTPQLGPLGVPKTPEFDDGVFDDGSSGADAGCAE
jgi:hypothetical protein